MANVTHVVTGMVRLSYVNVFTPRQREGQTEPKYSLTVLLPKQDTATMARIQAAVEAAKDLGAMGCWSGMRVDAPAPIYDGDGARPKDRTPYSPECHGHWVLNCSSKRKPEVVDANGNPIMNEAQVYSGCYGRVSLDFYPFSNQGGKGIGCGLGNVQKLQDGEPLGGGVTAAEDFGATGNAMPAPANPALANPAFAQANPGARENASFAQANNPAFAQANPTFTQANPGAPATGMINPITGLPM